REGGERRRRGARAGDRDGDGVRRDPDGAGRVYAERQHGRLCGCDEGEHRAARIEVDPGAIDLLPRDGGGVGADRHDGNGVAGGDGLIRTGIHGQPRRALALAIRRGDLAPEVGVVLGGGREGDTVQRVGTVEGDRLTGGAGGIVAGVHLEV